jgi:hypothetical protein
MTFPFNPNPPFKKLRAGFAAPKPLTPKKEAIDDEGEGLDKW